MHDAILNSFEGFYEVLYKTGLTEDVKFFVKFFTEYLKLKEKNVNDTEEISFKIYNLLSSILIKMRAYHMDLENLSKMEKIAKEKLDKIEQEESSESVKKVFEDAYVIIANLKEIKEEFDPNDQNKENSQPNKD